MHVRQVIFCLQITTLVESRGTGRPADVLHSLHAERLLQVLQRPLRLGVLLVQRVIEDDLVSLDQTLTVLLPMLQLLISVPLDAL